MCLVIEVSLIFFTFNDVGDKWEKLQGKIFNIRKAFID